MHKGDIVVRVRGQRFDQVNCEDLAEFVRAIAKLYAPCRFVRISANVLILRRTQPKPQS